MIRRDPLRQGDLVLTRGYGFFLIFFLAWLIVAGMAFQSSPQETDWLQWLVRKAPPILAYIQGGFFFLASQFRPFRQRLMSPEANAKQAMTAAVTLWIGAFLFDILLVS